MTLQQMQYIIAIDKYRQFVKAAQSCSITQSTLSMMVRKLEEELDTIIFDRDSHPIKPTAAGEKIISQAKVILFNTEQLKEMVLSERETTQCDINLAIIPTIAPDIIPTLFKVMRKDAPELRLHTYELQTDEIIEKLNKAEIDMAIMSTPLRNPSLLEIPLYYEEFMIYISPSEDIFSSKEILSSAMPTKHLWALKEGNCLRDQVFAFCSDCSEYTARYEAGSIDTLVRIVDENGGYTILPELHIVRLDDRQKKNIRRLVNPKVAREISIVVRKDYVKEKILNIVIDSVKKIIPEHMIDKRLKKFAVRLLKFRK